MPPSAPGPVTYSRKSQMAHPLRHSPSLIPNNLTSHGSNVAYSRGDAVIVSSYGENKLTSLPFGDKVQVKGVQYLDFGWVCVLAVCMIDGFQLWSNEGSRMLFFHPVRPSSDSESCYVRGCSVITDRNEFLIGDSSGAMHTFLCSQSTSRGLSVKNTKSIREHGSAISDIASGGGYVASADDRGNFCVFDVNVSEPTGGHNLMSKRLFITSEKSFPCGSIECVGSVLIAGFSSGHLKFFDLGSGECFVEVAAHSRCISAVCLNEEAGFVATASEDCVLNVWKVPDSPSDGSQVDLTFTEYIPDRQLTGVTFLTDGHGENKMLASSYDSDTLDVWKEIRS
ncbi:hypothetical protein TrVE_jg4761 [Triparma verrucosa]|uniref:WD repeat-containing protein 54 beta-propeller domain-containing protein n=1 Tax=Triparma verrucosa TaxID=1606542 RepID=A0A9W7CAX3_9STRA|nr:hypothetical protein TrVE_jg4761 [Triparma verrucosa]